jgi:hypothetical protein
MQWSALAFSWAVIALAPLSGATLERLSLDDMIEKSTAIVRGRVTGASATMTSSGIFTHLRIEVAERWKGPEQASLEVLIPGGTVGRFRQSVAGVPQLVTGKEYLLFLWTGPSGRTQVIGFTQGVFSLPQAEDGSRKAVRTLTSETILDPETGNAVKDERIEMPLREMSARISARLAGGSSR